MYNNSNNINLFTRIEGKYNFDILNIRLINYKKLIVQDVP